MKEQQQKTKNKKKTTTKNKQNKQKNKKKKKNKKKNNNNKKSLPSLHIFFIICYPKHTYFFIWLYLYYSWCQFLVVALKRLSILHYSII